MLRKKMKSSKLTNNVNQDPDYILEFNSNEKHQKLLEYYSRINTSKKISAIIEAEFQNEMNKKKKEIFCIYKNLNKACKMLHYLRFATVTDFYNQGCNYNKNLQTKQFRMHSTINPSTKVISMNTFENFYEVCNRKRKSTSKYEESKKQCLHHFFINNSNIPSLSCNQKIRRRIIVGNISKWISPNIRENKASHKWTLYVRDSENNDISQFISKVRIFLHPSYKPNDVIELTSSPFHLSRHGWGEFPVRLQLHFINTMDKPVNIIHHLKLDRTFTGLQTIGSETIIDLSLSLNDSLTVSNTKEIIENHHFLNDHNYVGKDIVYGRHINNYLKESEIIENNKFKELQIFCKPKQCLLSSCNFFHDLSLTKTLEHNNESKTDLDELISDKFILTKRKFVDSNEDVENSTISDKHKFQNHNIQSLSPSTDLKKNDLKHSLMSNLKNCTALTNLIQYTKSYSFLSNLKFVIHRFPLITGKSIDSDYKILHPYASESYQLFNTYSKGKQRSLERYRALSIQDVMQKTKSFESIYNIKELIVWARKYCYTPFTNMQNLNKISKLNDTKSIENFRKSELSSTTSHELQKWMLKCQKLDMTNTNFSQNDEQIEILNMESNILDSLIHHNLSKQNNSCIFLEYPKTQNTLTIFIFKCIEKIGIKLENEEILPGILHPSSSVVMTRAVECLIDDIIRIAFSCAVNNHKKTENKMLVTLDDVRTALLQKEEFEVFTNIGLGSER